MSATSYSFRDHLYRELINSPLADEISGKIFSGYRDKGSTTEDIVFYDFGAGNDAVQRAYMILNIYVPDIHNGAEYKEDRARCAELAQLAWEVLDEINLGDFFVEIEKQSSFAVQDEDVNEHGIRFDLNVKHF